MTESLRELHSFEVIDPAKDWTYYIDDLNQVRERIVSDLAIAELDRALDVGTGDGWWALAMRGLGARQVAAIELAPNEAAYAAKRARKLGHPEVAFLSMDAYQMAWKPDSFDLVGSFLAVQDICASTADLVVLLKEIHRVLIPRGTIVLATVTPEDAENESQRLGIELYQYIRAGYFTKAEVRAALTGAQFQPEPERFYYTGVNLSPQSALEFVKFQCGWWVDTFQMPTVDWKTAWEEYGPRIDSLGGLEVDSKLTIFVGHKE